MPFDLKNAPTVFYRTVIASFCDFVHKLLEVYMHDCIFYSILKEHIGLLSLMFEHFQKLHISMKLKNICFVFPMESYWVMFFAKNKS